MVEVVRGISVVQFPIIIKTTIGVGEQSFERSVTLHNGFTAIIGPNGSGKTHLLRAMPGPLGSHVSGKRVRFISAGRIGMMEQFRSDFDGHRSGSPRYDQATHGTLEDTLRRHQIETLEGGFQTLAVRPDILIKIGERLRKLFRRDIRIGWPGGSLKINFVSTAIGKKAYSSAREASGLVHLAGLLAAIYDEEVGALLIDEPEVSLHPQLQAFLLREMLSVAGIPENGSNKKIIVICTHSTEFLRVEAPADLSSIVLCEDVEKQPIQITPDSEVLRSNKVAELIARMGQEHKLSFFSRTPLLVEGPSDTIVSAGLCSLLGIHVEAGGSQLLPVIGKGEFPAVIKLMRLLGKSPLLMADADAFADGVDVINLFLNTATANSRAVELGASGATNLGSAIYNDFCKAVDSEWALIQPLAEQTTYWLRRDKGKDEKEAKRRAAFVSLMSRNDSVVKALGGIWFDLRKRTSALLALLEEEGCFILRRGTIEDYYFHADPSTVSAKPAEAAAALAAFAGVGVLYIETQFDDVIRCLRKAAATEEINEAEALRDILLAVAAPAFARVREGDVNIDLNGLAEGAVEGKADLFDLKNVDGKLVIELRSQVLDKSGFPITIAAEDDVVKTISRALGLASKVAKS